MQLPQHHGQAVKGKQGAGSHRDQDGIVKKGPEEVLADRPHGRPAQGDGPGNAAERPGRQDHVGRFDGHVGARTDGEAHVGLGQGRGIVDAVPHHGHGFAGRLQRFDPQGFVFRPDLGLHLIHTGLPTDRIGGPAVVSGEHHRLQAQPFQPGNGRRGVRLDAIRYADQSQQAVRFYGHHDGFPLGLKNRYPFGHRRGNQSWALVKPVRLAHPYQLPVYPGFDAVAAMGFEGLGRCQRQTRSFGFVDHRPSQGVLRPFFHRSGQHHQFIFRHPVAVIGNQVGDHRFAFGDGAGFVQDHRGQMGGAFQCPTVFEQHTPFGALTGAGHDRGRCGQTQGTGAGDDQYGHHADHGGHEIAGNDPPDRENQ